MVRVMVLALVLMVNVLGISDKDIYDVFLFD